MRQPTENDIEAAKAYLIERLSAEQSMEYNLESVMRTAAERIVAICYKAKANPQNFSYGSLPPQAQQEIDEVIQWMQEIIDDYFRTLAIADHEENSDEILPLILGEKHGMTFGERLSDYCGKYRDELMVLIGAGLLAGIAARNLGRSIGMNLKRPYGNPLLAGGIDSPLSYGRGRTNSMFTAISDLTRYGIADAWMRNQYISDRRGGCLGWWVRRGSMYPCSLCDSMVGFHTDESELPPYHGHCACFAVPVYL